MRSGFFVLVAFAVAAFASDAAPQRSTATRDLPPPVVVAVADDEITVSSLELFCSKCAARIIAACRDIYGVTAVDFDHNAKLLTLRFATSLTSRERVLDGIDQAVASIP